MGYNFFDTFSILHFGTGIVVYYWGLSLPVWLIVNIIYETLENTVARKYIDKIPKWPGGKKFSDSIINSIGDTIFGILGWMFAAAIDVYLETGTGTFVDSLLKVIKNGKQNSAYVKMSDFIKSVKNN
jgi:hypothetical protein